MKEKIIGLNVADKFTIIVKDAKEVYGHDDSLPYNADFIVKKHDKEVFRGIAYNDGWGGLSNYEITEGDKEKAHEIINEINEYGEEHLCYKVYKTKLHLDFIDIIDNLVFLSIDGGANCGRTFKERALLKWLTVLR